MSSYHKILKQKHKAIAERSFKTKLELYLFHLAYSEQNFSFSIDDFVNFQITDELVDLYEKSWSADWDDPFSKNNHLTIEDLDHMITEWDKKQTQFRKVLLEAYMNEFPTVLSLAELGEVFPEDPASRICWYTDLSDDDFEKLRKKDLIKTKRARGKVMEIDRLNSNKEYSRDNIVLACYWANNAKTDEFTIEEFKSEIGPSMKRVFQNRLLKKFGASKES